MIIVRLKGGLGNQLFQYAAGLALARFRGVACRFDLSHYAQAGSRSLDLARLGVDLPEPTWWERCRLAAFPDSPWGNRLHHRCRQVLSSTRDRRRIDADVMEPKDLFTDPRRSLYLDGYWQDSRFFADIATDLRAKLLAALARLPVPVTPPRLQALLHVRRGDYTTARVNSGGLHPLPQAYYIRALDRLGLGRDAEVGLVSDDPAWVIAQWDLGVRLVPLSLNPPEVLADLRLMVAAPHLIIANSTLSWWGGWIGDRPGRRVLVPEDWSGAGQTLGRPDALPGWESVPW